MVERYRYSREERVYSIYSLIWLSAAHGTEGAYRAIE